MIDEITLEDIFEIGESLLVEGADPAAVVCCRGVIEHLYERYQFLPLIRPVFRDGEFVHLELEYKCENYYIVLMHIKGVTPYDQIVGWSDGGGRLENGEKFWDSGEFWYKDLDAYLERVNRRRRYLGRK